MFSIIIGPRKTKIILMLTFGLLLATFFLGQGKIVFSQDIADIARRITVRIEGAELGSGVLISKQGSTYYVLTTKHVVRYPDNYAVVTSDGTVHPVDEIEIRRIPEIDLAVVGFTSNQEYSLAKIGDSDLATETTPIRVAGFPLPGREINTSTYHITNGEITARPLIPNSEGYALSYSNITRPGMSGGPILNEKGELIGIHGISEAEPPAGEGGVTVPIAGWTNLGIPINIFRTAAPLMQIELTITDTSKEIVEDNSADCIDQLRYRNITSTEKLEDDELWLYPVTVIGPSDEEASWFGPSDVPGSSMKAVGCKIRHSGFLWSNITWRCPEPTLRVEAMSAADAFAQCNGNAQPDPSPSASARRVEAKQHEELERELASVCRPFRADYKYWEGREISHCSFDEECREEAKSKQREAEREWNANGCDLGDWGPIWGIGDLD